MPKGLYVISCLQRFQTFQMGRQRGLLYETLREGGFPMSDCEPISDAGASGVVYLRRAVLVFSDSFISYDLCSHVLMING
jgi:hypothetical protein